MKLYGLPGACSLVDHIALNWIGKPFEYIPVSREGLKVAPFINISPLGAVPAIDDDGFTLTQNIAILEYLAEKNPEAKLFGGARVISGLTDIGDQNARFAERYLKQEGINFAGGSLGGERARRIQFWPISGRVRQMALAKDEANVFETERRTKPAAPVDSGALELF